MKMHESFWVRPAPLWMGHAAAGSALPAKDFGQPEILRFAADSFMDDFMALLAKDPARMADLVAQPETWRGLVSTPAVDQALEPEKPKTLRQRFAARRALARQRLQRAGEVKSTLQKTRLPGEPILKLYQPAHQRYYLVSACLVCGVPGLPDHSVDAGKDQGAKFVLRRLLPPPGARTAAETEADVAAWDEYAFVTNPDGSGWQKLDNVLATPPGEELLPLFPATYQEDDERRRRLFAGLIPVGRRDAYLAANKTDSQGRISNGETRKTARKLLFRTQVAEPWKNIMTRAVGWGNSGSVLRGDNPGDPDLIETLTAARAQLQTASWYTLLDFAEFLQEYLPQVWAAVESPATAPLLSDPNQANLLSAIRGTALPSGDTPPEERGTYGSTASLADALKRAMEWKTDLEAVRTSFKFVSSPPALNAVGRATPSWPDFVCPLADVYYSINSTSHKYELHARATTVSIPSGAVSSDETGTDKMLQQDTAGDLHAERESIDKLVALVVKALPADDPQGRVPVVPVASRDTLFGEDGVFRIRCVQTRPQCGELHPQVVSDPSRVFRLAAFFDPDAPARPIRIGLPVDTTPAGLRKFNKNTAFVMSDILCGQVQRFKGITLGDLVLSVLPWPFHKDLSVSDGGPCKTNQGTDAGMMCTLSIPIITICALILLMVMVNLLDMIFRWIPWFITCFPIPGLKGKR